MGDIGDASDVDDKKLVRTCGIVIKGFYASPGYIYDLCCFTTFFCLKKKYVCILKGKIYSRYRIALNEINNK